jgi:8-oxo-dGTP pyrophosphatase MutT (NUDIX family)
MMFSGRVAHSYADLPTGQVRQLRAPQRRGITAAMAKHVNPQPTLRIRGYGKRETRTQFAALPFRRKKSGVELLLVSTLDSKRWIIPKGWPMDGVTPAEAAAQEAWEEAGARGRIYDACIGLYSYSKWLDEELSLPCVVAVFGLEVQKIDDKFPESGRRKRKWLTPKKAAARVEEPELKQLLRHFDPARLR